MTIIALSLTISPNIFKYPLFYMVLKNNLLFISQTYKK